MEYTIPQKWSGTGTKLVVLALLTLFIIILTVFSLSSNIQILFTHIYYIPIIVAAYWFDRKGVLYAVLLSAFYIAAVYLISPYDTQTLLAAIGRVIVFIGISLVCALLSFRIKRQQEQIANSEERFRGIWEHIQAGIILIDAETHTVIAANPAAEEMVGYKENEMVGHVCHNFICPAEQGKCPISDLGMTVERAERILVARDGRNVPVLKTVNDVTIGKKRCFIENFINITKRKEAENALIAYIREATLRIRNPVELVRDNLDEIRNTLAGVTDQPPAVATALAIQEKNMDDILKNLQELERAIAEKRTEIPDALREYMKR